MHPLFVTDVLSGIIICSCTPSNLGFASQKLLTENKRHFTMNGDRSFSVAAPKLSNSLTSNIREIDELSSFSNSFKTDYLRKAVCQQSM